MSLGGESSRDYRENDKSFVGSGDDGYESDGNYEIDEGDGACSGDTMAMFTSFLQPFLITIKVKFRLIYLSINTLINSN